jgi:predicted RNase H-like HicB family nuclease
VPGVKYTVLVYEAEPDEGGYWAKVAELPGCVTQGETIDEIRENIVDAIEEYVHAQAVLGEEPAPQVAEKFEITVA